MCGTLLTTNHRSNAVTPFEKRMQESAERKAKIRAMAKQTNRRDGSRKYTNKQIADAIGCKPQYVGQVLAEGA